VIEHWYALVPGFSASGKDFLRRYRKGIEGPGCSGSTSLRRIRRGGVLSSKREYLRMTRERLIFDICAARLAPHTFSVAGLQKFLRDPVMATAGVMVAALMTVALAFGILV